MAEPVRLEDVKCIRGTDDAILCVIEGDEVWIPQSQILEDSEVWKENDEGVLIITEWIANKKGLI